MEMPQQSVTESATLQAEALFRTGAHREAAVRRDAALAEAPDDANLLRLRGLCDLRLGDTDAALARLARAYALAPDDAWARLHLGLGLHAAGRSSEAIPHFRACQTLLPDDPAPFLNLASALLAVGENEAARRAARRARLRAPDMPQAVYTVGLAELACGHDRAAADSFGAATRMAPGFVDAWINLGLARYRCSDVSGARTAMQKAVDLAPGNRAAAGNLAVFLRLTGEHVAGEDMLRTLLARDPGAVEARLNLAAALLQEDRQSEALALLDGTPPAAPRAARFWGLQRSLALIELGRTDEGATELSGIGADAETAPLLLWRRLLLARARRDQDAARMLAAEMERALAGAATPLPEYRIMAQFDLAKFWSEQSAPDSAMRCWTAGHALLKPFQPFSRAEYGAFVDATIEGFSRARLQEGPVAGNSDRRPVFIVGMPRSGTTLVEQILAAHPEVYGAGERNALASIFAALGGGYQSGDAARRAAGADRASLNAAANEYLAGLDGLAPCAGRIADKMPGNFRFAGLIACLLPGARVIHCVRDPRDTGLSIFTFRFHGYHPYAHDLGDIGWYIAQHDRLMAHWRTALPESSMQQVRLEDWADDFQGTLRRLLDFIGLPYDQACERFHELDRRVMTVSRAQVRQPVNRRGLGRWRAYAEQLSPLLAALAENGVVLPP